MLAIGLMSGTSADGIDAALVELSGGSADRVAGVPAGQPNLAQAFMAGKPMPTAPSPVRTAESVAPAAPNALAGPAIQIALRAFRTLSYPEPVRAELFDLFADGPGSPSRLCRLNFVLGELFAEAALAAAAEGGTAIEDVAFIASHGQTVWHQPEPQAIAGICTRSTFQIGEPAVIAERTGCTTVANFRARDMAAGGQGAPLVPYVDYLLLSHPQRPRIAQNIGGIANLTYLPPGGGADDVLAFDTGPGNAPIDAAVSLATGGREFCDRDGQRAASTLVDKALLSELLQHPYLTLPPPKSTGRELFGVEWVQRLLSRHVDDDTLVATLTRFTVETIALGYERWLPPLTPETEIVLSGGGARNPTLLAWLRDRVHPAALRLSDEFGLPIDAKEAMAFAVLGWETLHSRPANLPRATGAAHPVVLGQVTPGSSWSGCAG